MRPLFTFTGAVLLTVASAQAGEVWKSTFDSGPDGVVDIYDDNPTKVTIGAASGGALSLTVQDSASFAQTDRAGRPLGATVDGNSEYSGLATFKLGALPADGDTWTQIGFSNSSGNPGIARQVSAAFMRFRRNGSGEVLLNVGLQWGSSSGQDRNKLASSINLGDTAAAQSKTFQLAISYLGGINGLTNTPDPTTGIMKVSLFDGAGTLLASVLQNNITAGDGGSDLALVTGLGPDTYPQFLANQQLTHLGVIDYKALGNGRQVEYLMDSLAYYDTADGAEAAVVPEPASFLLLLAAVPALRRRRAA